MMLRGERPTSFFRAMTTSSKSSGLEIDAGPCTRQPSLASGLRPTGLTLMPTTSSRQKNDRQASKGLSAPVNSHMPRLSMPLTAL